jgi:hypothetical protein
VTRFDQHFLDGERLAHLGSASDAASTSSLSSTVRRGAYDTAESGLAGDPSIVNGPKSNA